MTPLVTSNQVWPRPPARESEARAPGAPEWSGPAEDADDADLASLSLAEDGAVLVLHGEVSFSAIPQLDALLDSVIALEIPSLAVDLRDTTSVASDALDAIKRRDSPACHLQLIGAGR